MKIRFGKTYWVTTGLIKDNKKLRGERTVERCTFPCAFKPHVHNADDSIIYFNLHLFEDALYRGVILFMFMPMSQFKYVSVAYQLT